MASTSREASRVATVPLLLQATPAQRLQVQGVMALTGQLVRGIGSRADAASMQELVEERHRMLRELGHSVTDDAAIGCLAALTAAVIESDLALETMGGVA
jgi:hypothetical protein